MSTPVRWALLILFVGCGGTDPPTRKDPARGKADTNRNETCRAYFASGRAAGCDCTASREFQCGPLPRLDEAYCRRLVDESTVCCQTDDECERVAGFTCAIYGICVRRDYRRGYLHDRKALNDIFDACPAYCREEINRGCQQGLPEYCNTHPCETDEDTEACFDCEAFCQKHRAIAEAEMTID